MDVQRVTKNIFSNAYRFSEHQKLLRHPGFDARLCYGDVTLGFRYFPDGLPEAAEVDREEQYDQIAPGATTTITAESLPTTPGIEPQKHHWISAQLKQSAVCAMCRLVFRRYAYI